MVKCIECNCVIELPSMVTDQVRVMCSVCSGKHNKDIKSILTRVKKEVEETPVFRLGNDPNYKV